LYAFSKHEEQTLVHSERANAGEKKIEKEREREKKRNTAEKDARRVVFLLIIQFILSFCLYFFPFPAMEMELGYL
jgi:polyferredoxin